jgi:hypothetical protein
VIGDIFHYIHPPPLTIFWPVKEEGERLHSFPQCVLLYLHPLQLGLHVGHRLHGLYQISISTTLYKLNLGKFFTRSFCYHFNLIMLGSQGLIEVLHAL